MRVAPKQRDKKTEKPLAEVFADFLCGLPEIVPTGDLSKGLERAAKKSGVNFNEARSIDLDQGSVELRDAARKRAKEAKISFGEALREIRSEGFQPVAGGAAAGSV